MSVIIPHLNKRRSLILVDLQAGFLGEHNKHVITYIREVIRSGGYTLFIEAIFHADPGSLWQTQEQWTFPLQPTVPEIKGLLPFDTITTVKATKSVFKGTVDVVAALKAASIEEVHIVGLDTNDCVFATAQESFDLGFSTYVLEECTASSEGARYKQDAIEILRELNMTNHSVHA